MRPIDAENLYERKCLVFDSPNESIIASYQQGWNDAIDAIIENEPTLDMEPAKHGSWMTYNKDGWPDSEDTEYFQCDQCLALLIGQQTKRYNYCPICGAHM